MSTTEELKNMVLQFKVSDLQLLLGFAGQNKNGRKSDLQKKALNLIQCRKSVPLEMKVRNIYRALVAENAASESRDDYFRPSFDKYNNYGVHDGYSSQSGATNGGYSSYGARNAYYADGGDYYSMWSGLNNGYSTNTTTTTTTSANTTNTTSNNNNYNNNNNSNNNSSKNFRTSSKFDYASYLEPNAVVPDADELKHLVFKKLSFYKFKSCIYALTPLVPRGEHAESFEFALQFNLNQQEHSLINWAKKSGKESRYQVQLRICALDADARLREPHEIGDALPLALGVKVNDKNCQLPPAIPSTNKQGMLLKRMNAPINLTPQTRRNHANNLVVNWSTECNRVYAFAIHLVEKFTADELVDELLRRGERDPQVTKRYLNEKLSALGDDDIAATSLKVSLLCPLGKILMTLPVRATTCNHLQCFDGTLYVKMNEVKSVWQCPVCNKACLYEDLFVDGYFADILREGRFGSNVSEIQIEADGSIAPVVPKKRSNNSSSSSPSLTDGGGTTRKRLKLKQEPLSSSGSVDKRESSWSPPSENVRPWPSDCQKSFVDSTTSSLPPFVPLFTPPGYSSSSSSYAEQNMRAQRVASKESSRSNGEASSSLSSIDLDQAKKNVVLVDLTDTDSESEDCLLTRSPPNGATHCDAHPSSVLSSAISHLKSPPVFDIEDSDHSLTSVLRFHNESQSYKMKRK